MKHIAAATTAAAEALASSKQRAQVELLTQSSCVAATARSTALYASVCSCGSAILPAQRLPSCHRRLSASCCSLWTVRLFVLLSPSTNTLCHDVSNMNRLYKALQNLHCQGLAQKPTRASACFGNRSRSLQMS